MATLNAIRGTMTVGGPVSIEKSEDKGMYPCSIHADLVFDTVADYNRYAEAWNSRIGREIGKILPIYPE